MPIRVPAIDDRSFEQLKAEALARIPSHHPQWTNFSEADPGVTLLELFAFLTESLLYRANQIPERNRRAFLSLLRVPLQPATAARGLVVIENRSGPLEARTLPTGLELRAGPVPFRTEQAIDVLPVEASVFRKRRYTEADPALRSKYDALYTAQKLEADARDLDLYVTTPFPEADRRPVDLGDGDEAVDNSLWVALLVRAADAGMGAAEARRALRKQLAGKTLQLGLAVAAEPDAGRTLDPGARERERVPVLSLSVPDVQPLPPDDARRDARYATRLEIPLPVDTEVVGVPLPADSEQVSTWEDLKPLEEGTRDFPPALEEAAVASRVVTWLRIRAPAGAVARLAWVGVNAVPVTQRTPVRRERLPDGTGEPDQRATLGNRPVLADSVRIRVAADGTEREWRRVEDLLAAPREEPAARGETLRRASEVFALDPEAGEIRFGDGLHGARPAPGAVVLASYDHARGSEGNVGEGAIRSGDLLPGFAAQNPLPTRGGADAESIARGEKQVARWLQHRDRLVSAADFEALTLRTPGADVGRVEVLPAYHPALSREPGDAPGSVTLLVIPRGHPYPPPVDGPDDFLASIACWLEPRRLVTTELHLRRPAYVGVWVSLGVNAIAGFSVPALREAVRAAVESFLSPLPDPGVDPLEDGLALFDRPERAAERRGWPLRSPVSAGELLTWVARVPGVQRVRQVRIAAEDGEETDTIPLERLQLPRLAACVVSVGGNPPEIASLRGQAAPAPAVRPATPVPVVPEECR
jgi:predicted phage baseplate assembly protein